jgi:hypothetical protein
MFEDDYRLDFLERKLCSLRKRTHAMERKDAQTDMQVSRRQFIHFEKSRRKGRDQ